MKNLKLWVRHPIRMRAATLIVRYLSQERLTAIVASVPPGTPWHVVGTEELELRAQDQQRGSHRDE
jgi:hypothetical protein